MDKSSTLSMSIDQIKMSSKLLTLPKEIRYRIWRALQDDMNADRREVWHKKPTFEFASLSLACRQLYHEIQDYRPQYVVPFDRYYEFYTQLRRDFNIPLQLRLYRSVTIEFRLDTTAEWFTSLAAALRALGPTLEEFRLSFVGPDGFGVPTYLHGCGYAKEHVKEPKLSPDGQRINVVLPVMRQIERMLNLRVLVLSNLNIQVFMTCLVPMTKLKYLHITADPRSPAHTYFHALDRFSALALPIFTIPLKVLNISANAMLNASVLLTKCASTIEHLTWTIPDASLGSNITNAPHFSRTESLLSLLALQAHNLKTLRICIAGRGNFDRYAPQELGNLQYGLSTAIGAMRELRDLEIHFGEQGLVPRYWSMGTEVMRTLPSQLERLYTNDRLVMPRDLHKAITQRYLSSSTAGSPPRGFLAELRSELWSPKPPYPEPRADYFPEHRTNIPEDEQIKMWMFPTSYTETYWEDGEVIGAEITRSQAHQNQYSMYDPGIIGEDLNRKDFIPLREGNLKFVSYQFENPGFDCETDGVNDETQTQMVLRLNGRLLDRERNKHLAVWQPTQHIPFHITCEEEQEKPFSSRNINYNIMLYHLYDPEYTMPRRYKEAMKELAMSPLTDDPSYFGTETQAQCIFEDERVAKPDMLKPALYPYFIDVDLDDQCHWMCPEADVPTLAQIIEDEERGEGEIEGETDV